MSYFNCVKKFIEIEKQSNNIQKFEKLKNLLVELETIIEPSLTSDEIILFNDIQQHQFVKNRCPRKEDIIQKINTITSQSIFSFAKIYSQVYFVKDNNKHDEITESAYDLLINLKRQCDYCHHKCTEQEWQAQRPKPFFDRDNRLVSKKCTMPRSASRVNFATLNNEINKLLQKNYTRMQQIKNKRKQNV